jgi:hypothetical protein
MTTELSHRSTTVAAVGCCDRCPAAARYGAALSTGALLFCRHHAPSTWPACSRSGPG